MQSRFTGKICPGRPERALLLCDWRILWARYRYRRLTTRANSFLLCDCLARCHNECPRGHRFDSRQRPTPQSAYAARKLGEALDASSDGWSVTLKISPKALSPEAFAITPRGKTIAITGGDARGLIYGALALREQLLNGTPIEQGAPPAREKPALPFRGIKFNTPWDTYRPSSALDQHYATARDLKFWEAWLDMMVENRFNAFTLWTMHPFTYMVRPTNFPEASKWSRRGVRRVAAPVPRNLSHGEGARARYLRGVLEHLRERGVREGARRRERELLPALLRAGRHLRHHEALSARERHADARGVSGPRRHRRVAWRRHGAA